MFSRSLIVTVLLAGFASACGPQDAIETNVSRSRCDDAGPCDGGADDPPQEGDGVYVACMADRDCPSSYWRCRANKCVRKPQR